MANHFSVEASGDLFRHHKNLLQQRGDFVPTSEDILVSSYSTLFENLDDESRNSKHDDDDDDFVNDSIIPVNPKFVFSVPSLGQMRRNESISSKLSSSENTTRHSNRKSGKPQDRDCSPPNCIDGGIGCDMNRSGNHPRSIFGRQTKKKYNVRRGVVESKASSTQIHCWVSGDTGVVSLPAVVYSPIISQVKNKATKAPLQTVGCKVLLPVTPAQAQIGCGSPNGRTRWMTVYPAVDGEGCSEQEGITTKQYVSELHVPLKLAHGTNTEHHRVQALLLSISFFFIWSSQNLLAPNLTQAAVDFGFDNDNARDLYLGSNLALVSSVLSLPLSALLGFASDLVTSRRMLISMTTLVGGMAAFGTGMATTYPVLLLCRFISGSAMNGSVSVVFSLLSDWFDEKDRNAASALFTAMISGGIIVGQVYAGCTGPTAGWRHPFYMSGIVTMMSAIVVLTCIRDPIRGGKEKALREMLASGRRYDRTLTQSQFISSMTNHQSNVLLMLQGFFINVPWGVMFVFLNDFLSQEKGLGVQDATFIVAVFGFGCAIGGILGGFIGSLAGSTNRCYLPTFMASMTLMGAIPFLALLDDTRYDHAGWLPCFYAFSGGCLASMPSVNIRPCIINVNPPEIRGAALTAANLIISAARGAGPSILTTVLMGFFGVSRSYGLNVLVITFWTIGSLQLALLAKTLPSDQARMEKELSHYALSSVDAGYGSISDEDGTHHEFAVIDRNKCVNNIENQASTFDVAAVRQSFEFVGGALNEIYHNGLSFCPRRHDVVNSH